MVDYNVKEFITDRMNNVCAANSEIKEYLKTIDSSKTIRFVKVSRVGVLFEGLVIHDV